MNLAISIIIPTFNIEAYIGQCLNSLASQTLSQDLFEVIVIDDGSSDQTLTILNKFEGLKNFKVLGAPEKIGAGGPGLARNKGLKEARGKYIVFLDGDDYLEPHALETLYENTQDEPDAVVYDWAYSDNPNRTPQKRDFSNITTDKELFIENYLGMSVSGDVIYTSVKREVFEKNNILFAQSQHEDVAMIFKMLYLSSTIKKLKGEVLYRKCNREGSVVNSFATQYVDGYLGAWPDVMRFLMRYDSTAGQKYIRFYLRGLNGLVYTLLSRCLNISRVEDLQKRKEMYRYIVTVLRGDEFIKNIPFTDFPRQTKKDGVAHEFYALMSKNVLSDHEVLMFEEKTFPTTPSAKATVQP